MSLTLGLNPMAAHGPVRSPPCLCTRPLGDLLGDLTVPVFALNANSEKSDTAAPRFAVFVPPRDNEADIESARVILLSTENERAAWVEIEKCRTVAASVIVLKEGIVEEVRPGSTTYNVTVHGFEDPSLIAMKKKFQDDILPRYAKFESEMSPILRLSRICADQMRLRFDTNLQSTSDTLGGRTAEVESTHEATIEQFQIGQTKILQEAIKQLRNAITRYRGTAVFNGTDVSNKIFVIANKKLISHLSYAQIKSFNEAFGKTIIFKPRENANSTPTTSSANSTPTTSSANSTPTTPRTDDTLT